MVQTFPEHPAHSEWMPIFVKGYLRKKNGVHMLQYILQTYENQQFPGFWVARLTYCEDCNADSVHSLFTQPGVIS